MPVFGWDDDHDPALRAGIDRNLQQRVLRLLVNSAKSRAAFSHRIACEWHKEMLHGVTVDPPIAGGNIRDSAWFGGELDVGGWLCVRTAEVPAAIDILDRQLAARVNSLDGVVPVGTAPTDSKTAKDVLVLAADLHGEWVRIHPFVNGNGRTARLWVNWLLIRYAMPPLLAVSPRPQHGATVQAGRPMTRYEAASYLSLAQGYHRVMYALLKRLYDAQAP